VLSVNGDAHLVVSAVAEDQAMVDELKSADLIAAIQEALIDGEAGNVKT
jgi:hypothetical protein